MSTKPSKKEKKASALILIWKGWAEDCRRVFCHRHCSTSEVVAAEGECYSLPHLEEGASDNADANRLQSPARAIQYLSKEWNRWSKDPADTGGHQSVGRKVAG